MVRVGVHRVVILVWLTQVSRTPPKSTPLRLLRIALLVLLILSLVGHRNTYLRIASVGLDHYGYNCSRYVVYRPLFAVVQFCYCKVVLFSLFYVFTRIVRKTALGVPVNL